MEFHYFAYGSNMLGERLRNRCPSATVYKPARADGWDVSFSKKSKDGSGKATIVKSANHYIFGIVFKISDRDLHDLDRHEGAGDGYDRIDDFTVFLPDTALSIVTTTYIANDHHLDEGRRPYDWYLKLVVAGARQNMLPTDYVARLSATAYDVDSNSDRKQRLTAMRLLNGLEFTALPPQ